MNPLCFPKKSGILELILPELTGLCSCEPLLVNLGNGMQWRVHKQYQDGEDSSVEVRVKPLGAGKRALGLD